MPRRFSFLLLFFFFVLGVGFKAYAQDYVDPGLGVEDKSSGSSVINPYDPKYRNQSAPVISGGGGMGLVSDSQFFINFVRLPDSSSNEVVLRLSQPSALTGCVNISMPEATMKKLGLMLQVEVGRPAVNVGPSSGKCQGITSPTLDIPLKISQLKTVKKLVLRSVFGQDEFGIEVAKNRITLIPKSVRLFHPNHGVPKGDPLVHWFYPKNTVLLFAPLAPETPEAVQKLYGFARARGLMELEHALPGFRQPLAERGMFYFTDPAGIATKPLLSNDIAKLGFITKEEDFWGPDGMYQKIKRVDVLAKRPGILE